MTLVKVLIPTTLIAIGIVDIQFRKELVELILMSLGDRDPDWGRTLETVQLASGIGFIVTGIGIALAFMMGFDPWM